MSINIIKPMAYITDKIDGKQILKKIEWAGRHCYKSEDLITDESAEKFIKMIMQRNHLSILEHVSVTTKFVIDRGVSHELVRHRHLSPSQESTRYCDYSKDKFDNKITIIDIGPHFKNESSLNIWLDAMEYTAKAYETLIKNGESAQMARSVLPNSLKTEVIATCNLREWHLVFTQRTSVAAHPQMREVMEPLLKEFQENIPIIFDNI